MILSSIFLYFIIFLGGYLEQAYFAGSSQFFVLGFIFGQKGFWVRKCGGMGRGREGEEEAGGRVGGLRERKEEFNLKIAGRGPLTPYNKMNQH